MLGVRRMPFLLIVLLGFVAGVKGQAFELKGPATAGKPLQIMVSKDFHADSICMVVDGQTLWKKNGVSEDLIQGPIATKSGLLNIISYKQGVAQEQSIAFRPMPAWLSLLPPLIAIFFAIALKEVISALFLGILSGVFLHLHYVFPSKGPFSALYLSISDYILPAVANSDHMSVIIFSLLIGGTVAVISRNGGMAGMVNHIARYARNGRSAQLATWGLGILIFFDDYANTLVVGNTMRPITDKLRVSREKLAYIVDSTAAPVASIAFVTTWIGAQLGYINDGVASIDGLDISAYSVFMSALKYSFYPVFTLVFILLLILLKKDFGPMWHSEARAMKEDHPDEGPNLSAELKSLDPDTGVPLRAFNAIIPIMVLIAGTLLGLWNTGFSEEVWNNATLGFWQKVSAIIGDADSYKSLLWSSACALGVSIILSLSQRILTLEQNMSAAIKGFGFMLNACIILCLAWTISALTGYLGTAHFITHSLQQVHANPYWFPTLTFILAALVSFSTGSSWSTMAILYPLLLPASWLLCEQQSIPEADSMSLFFHVVNAVLAGSVLGDHCSPISDTTILSSLASSCNHLSHVRTQLPYALTVGAIALVFGTIPASFGVPVWLLYPLGFTALFMVIRGFGKSLPNQRA